MSDVYGSKTTLPGELRTHPRKGVQAAPRSSNPAVSGGGTLLGTRWPLRGRRVPAPLIAAAAGIAGMLEKTPVSTLAAFASLASAAPNNPNRLQGPCPRAIGGTLGASPLEALV